MQALIEDLGNVLSEPFVGSVDLKQLFLIVGAVIVFAAVWFFVLQHMKSAAEEII